jgi:hypothetical protein
MFLPGSSDGCNTIRFGLLSFYFCLFGDVQRAVSEGTRFHHEGTIMGRQGDVSARDLDVIWEGE